MIAVGHPLVVTGMVDRAVLAHPLFTGISTGHLVSLVEELARPWTVAAEGRRVRVRGGVRKRAPGAGARYRLVFVDRLVVTLIHLRHDLPHAVLGVLFGVDRSTVTRAVGEVRELLAERGFAVPDRPGLRLRTVEDVFAYAQAEGVELRLDATEIQARRPVAGRGGRRAFISGKKKQNTMKATVIADFKDRMLWTDGLRPGRMHDATAARAAGITGRFQYFDLVEVLLDDGYLGLSRDHPGQAITPPRKPRPGATARQSRAVGMRASRALLRPHHCRARTGRRQTLEPTDAVDPSPRSPARHLPSHRRSRLRPHRHRLKVGDEQARPNHYHAPTRKLRVSSPKCRGAKGTHARYMAVEVRKWTLIQQRDLTRREDLGRSPDLHGVPLFVRPTPAHSLLTDQSTH